MTTLARFFNIDATESLKGISHKNNIIKRNIIAYMALNGDSTLSELTRELHISVPTMTKLVQELVDDRIVIDLGKVETPGLPRSCPQSLQERSPAAYRRPL